MYMVATPSVTQIPANVKNQSDVRLNVSSDNFFEVISERVTTRSEVPVVTAAPNMGKGR